MNKLNFILLVSLLLLFHARLSAQHLLDCGTKSPLRLLRTPTLPEKRANESIQIRLFVHVLADNNGANRASTDADVIRQLENTQLMYGFMDICFKLIDIQQINNTDLNDHNVDHESGELLPYLRLGCLNIFVHQSLYFDDGTLNGSAYAIPNTFLSMSAEAIADVDNISTMAHEMGHCFGLYHTFETAEGAENVARSGSCKNCDDSGDLLCDTPADPHSEDYDTEEEINASCIYSGTIQDDCGSTYQMNPHNVMAYGRRACRNDFTTSQGQRMRSFIQNTPGLADCVSAENFTFSPVTNQIWVSGYRFHTARNSILVQGINYEISGTSSGYFSAPSVTILPKVHLRPGTGQVVITPADDLCD